MYNNYYTVSTHMCIHVASVSVIFMYIRTYVCMYVRICMYDMYSTAHFKLDDTRVQQLHGSTRFQKCTQHFPRAHDRPMTYYHWKLHACMHDTFVLLACVA